MMIILIIFSYIISIFLARYLNIKVEFYIHKIHYRIYIFWWIWFIPIINVFMPLINYLSYKIELCKIHSTNKFINWFFVGSVYVTNEEIKFKNEFDHEFNKK